MDCKRKRGYCFIKYLLYKTISNTISFSLCIIKYLQRVQLRRKSHLALKKLSDEQLKDIGLTRDDLP
ncbi:DUF1127 domain-containing protein [Trabulsiella odontotermitis]|uniref:DUF1127 domain-containing protein n=1 Tax=Trabulsiella odontotermitis TaxID=379893 RepID=UPI0024B7571B|nr:DUF1127 domain-containing protein [Trabulsiella odontotermitis]WHP29808.1 DUF1127 domain-containing protein [Trabulsiella odontotermitis]